MTIIVEKPESEKVGAAALWNIDLAIRIIKGFLTVGNY